MNSSYASCVATVDCRFRASVVNGTHYPARNSAYGVWRRLTDIQMRVGSSYNAYSGWHDGTKTTGTSTSPFMTLELEGAYDDVQGVSL